MISKAQWRVTLRARREAISPADRLAAAQKAAAHLIEADKFKSSTHIALYYAVGGEFPTKALIDTCLAYGKKVYLPVIDKAGLLTFHAFSQGATLIANQFGILEPKEAPLFPAHELDLLFLPLVGFDAKGNRLGVGGGYYDRLLKSLESRPILSIGLAYTCQEVDLLPKEPQDQPIQGVLTENGFRFWY